MQNSSLRHGLNAIRELKESWKDGSKQYALFCAEKTKRTHIYR
jgi:hypothetical protein